MYQQHVPQPIARQPIPPYQPPAQYPAPQLSPVHQQPGVVQRADAIVRPNVAVPSPDDYFLFGKVIMSMMVGLKFKQPLTVPDAIEDQYRQCAGQLGYMVEHMLEVDGVADGYCVIRLFARHSWGKRMNFKLARTFLKLAGAKV
jgi:hypothetical protein